MSSTPNQKSNNESCGYVTFVLSNAFAILYALYAFLPDSLIQQIDEQYGITHYPPRELAVYIPTYLVILFFCVPIMYMGLNMLSAPKVDDVCAIWDTRSNECRDNHQGVKFDACTSDCKCVQCESSEDTGESEPFSIPSICDLDVRLVNQYMYQQLKKLD
ncbi:hypothetical protein ACHAWO_002164 [Cyclotella atomus]|uniref:PIG-P domain-containing protein n=1 Tax=Cyclotella atomus TaxID=382360 RepID=A0ABD3QMP1_9STRA